MNYKYLIVTLTTFSLSIVGCVNQNYISYLQCKLQPTDVETVRFVTGDLADASNMAEKSNLPHLSAKEQFIMKEDATNELRRQLGSYDYIMLGEMSVAGNAYSSMEEVKHILAKRAAKEGGDVVLIFNSGVETQPWSFTSPGHATSKTYGSATGSTYGNSTYISGQSTTNTTYTPPQTYSGVHHKPYIQGVIFKHSPGREDHYKKIISLTDEQFQQLIDYCSIYDDDDLSCEFIWDEVEKYLSNMQ